MPDAHFEFSIEEIARFPLPGMAVPDSFAFSPDGSLLAFLWSSEGSLVRQLYAFDIKSKERFLLLEPPGGGTSEENLSLEEKLRRERMRQRELGVTGFTWAGKGRRLLVPFPDGLYIQDEPGAALRRLVGIEKGPLQDPQASPDGQWVAFVQDSELYVVSCAGGEPRQVTSGGRSSGLIHGLAEFVAQEEMGRSHGYWWSPDSAWLAFEEVDERHIPPYTIVHQGKDVTGEAAQEQHRYPFAGQANARVRLGVVSREGSEPVWLDLNPETDDFYLARVHWLPDGRLSAQVQNREQTRLDLVFFDLKTGERREVLVEENPVWINLHDSFHPLKDGRFIWASERSGFRHLYLYSGDGMLLYPLTSGEWLVDGLVGVDEAKDLVYFTAGLENPLETQLYTVPLAGGEPQRLSEGAGTHKVVVGAAAGMFVDTHHALNRSPHITLNALDGGARQATLHDTLDPRIPELHLRPPELVTLHNRVGTELYGAVFQPGPIFGPGPYPTIVLVYGGPHVQLVADSWLLTVSMRAQYLRSLGYLVFVLDNRGSARRGLAFEGAIRHDLGHLEVEDQVDGVRWLVEHGLTDPKRVGITGWSYGGYMAAMCLGRAPAVFKVAVAGAPVASWDGYDTHYTERYMGTPQTNPHGYEVSSVMHHVPLVHGRLLLIHGLIDENVHFRHTARLINALIRARKPYDLLLFPDERHMPRRAEDRVFMEEQVAGYFHKYL